MNTVLLTTLMVTGMSGNFGPLAGSLVAGIGQSARVSPTDSEQTRMWVGLKITEYAPCPALGYGWVVTPDPSINPQTIAPRLRKFCLFESPNPPSPGKIPRALSDLGALRLQRVEADRAIVTPLGPLTDAVSPHLEALFAYRTGSLHSLPGGTSPVRLAFLDTSPTRASSENPHLVVGRHPHGHAMVNLARRLSTDDLGVKAKISTRLALPRFVDTASGEAIADWENGGYFGSLTDIARAIDSEVTAWQNSGREHLVINLSLGWLDELDNTGKQRSLPSSYVYEVMAEAYCQGVLFVAAAGNRTNGPENTDGPMLPAAWEQLQPPACGSSDTPGYRPLVHSVGASAMTGESLATSRRGGTPRLVAFGDHATTPPSQTDASPVAILSGSSVASATVSAIAAVTWAYNPSLTAHQVMEIVYATGRPGFAPAPADYCLGNLPCPVVREANLCSAIEEVCHMPGNTCTKPPEESCFAAPTRATMSPEEFAVYEAGSQPFFAGPFVNKPKVYKFCGQQALFNVGEGLAEEPCPAEQYSSVGAGVWAYGQPPPDSCPSCGLEPLSGSIYIADALHLSEGKLYLSNGLGLESQIAAVLTLVDQDGSRTYQLPLANGESAITIHLPLEILMKVTSATYTWLSEGGTDKQTVKYSVSHPLFILQ